MKLRAVINLLQLNAYARKCYLCRPFKERERSLSRREHNCEIVLKQDLFLHTTQCHFHVDIQEGKNRKTLINFFQLFSKYFTLKSSNKRKFPPSHLISPHVHRSKYLEICDTRLAFLYLHAGISYMPLSF